MTADGNHAPDASGAARGHSTATLYEAALGQWRQRAADNVAPPDTAVDPAIRPAWPGAALAGPAFTVRGAGGDNLALHRAVVAAPADHVIVADLDGAAHGHWGEILTVAAQQRDIAGLVIDGGVRDRDALRTLRFPVFSRHDSIRGTTKRVPGEFRTTIRVGGVPVAPGDLVVGDADGVVVIARHRIASVLDHADRRLAAEQAILTDVRSGRTTLDLYDLTHPGDTPDT